MWRTIDVSVPNDAEVRARDLRRAAIHEGAHAIVAIENGLSVQIRILPADDTVADPGISTVTANCVYSAGGKRVGKIRHSAFGVAGFCAEHINDHCTGDLSADLEDINYWSDEILGLLEEGAPMSETDQKAWRGLAKGFRRRAVVMAVVTILKAWPEIERIVSAVEAQFKSRGHAIFSWPPGYNLTEHSDAGGEAR